MVAGELGDPLLQLGGPLHRDGGPAVVGGRGVGPVGGQRELLGHAGEGVFPVGDLRGDAAVAVGEVAQLRALPQRVVDVLHGQRGPRRGAARAPAGVGGPEVGDHGGDRPAVGGDVVHDGNQDVLVVGDPEKGCAHGYFARKVERAPHFGVDGRAELVFHPAGGVHDVPAEVGALDGHHQLPGRPVLRREQGAQAFLAGHHVGQRHAEGVGVQRSAQSQGHGEVVDRRRALDLVDDPQPGLGERQRDDLGPLGGRQGLQPALVAADAGRQLGDGRRLEHDPHGQAGVEGVVDGGHQAHRGQRVATEVEERVVHADALGAQHLGVDADQDLLGEGARGAVAPGVLVVRCGQGAGVEFAVDRQRQRLQRHHRRRHHVGGQALGQGGAQLGRFGGSGDVADQAFVAGPVLAGDHRRLGDAVQTGQHGLHLAGFDPVAADLDLFVGAPEVVQLPVGAPAHQIAGAVHAGPGGPERAGDKPRRGQSGAAEVADGHPVAGHVELPDHTHRHRSQRFVENDQRGGGDRRPDRRGSRAHLQRRAHRCVDGDLGGAVGVDHHPAGCPLVHDLGRAGLAAEQHRHGLQALRAQRGHRGRGLGQHVDPFAGEQGVEVPG